MILWIKKNNENEYRFLIVILTAYIIYLNNKKIQSVFF